MRTGHTVVTRESEWDDESRGRALRLQEFEDSICRCGCGLPMAEAHKPQPFKVDSYIDYADRAIKGAERAARTKAEKEAGGKLPEDWGDGRRFYAVIPDPSELREDPRGN